MSEIRENKESAGFEQETPGIAAQRSVAAFLKSAHPSILDVEPTDTGGINDLRHTDMFLQVNGGLTFSLDVNGATGERRRNKLNLQENLPFTCRYDEVTGKPASGEMPHFVFDVNLGLWNLITHQLDKGLPIGEIMSSKEQRNSLRDFLGQIWLQMQKLSRNSSEYQNKIKPYKEFVIEAARQVFDKKELGALGME